jgi:hypothetical protein
MSAFSRTASFVFIVVLVVGASTGSAQLAGITWVPEEPEISDLVTFSITGFAVPVIAEWDFGENGCVDHPRLKSCTPSTTMCHEMTFQFASGGEKTITAKLYRPWNGTLWAVASQTISVEPTGFCDAIGDPVFVPESMNAVGIEDSLFHHSMSVFNPERTEIPFSVDWLPYGQNNNPPPLSATVTVPGEAAVRFENLLSDVLGLAPNTLGALRFPDAHPSLEFRSLELWTHAEGERGWSIPTVRPSDRLSAGDQWHLINLGENSDFRSNFVCVNLTTNLTHLQVDLFRNDGGFLRGLEFDLLPLDLLRFNQVFRDFSPVLGTLRFSTTTPGAGYSCTGTALTNIDNDPRSEPLRHPSKLSDDYYLAGAVNDTESRTDLVLFAPDGPAVASIELLPTGNENTFPASLVVPIPQGEAMHFPSILGSIFGYTGTAALRIVVTSGAVLPSATVSKTVGNSESHRYAAFHRSGDRTLDGEHAALIHLKEGPNYRTDINLVNTSEIDIDLSIDFRDDLGGFFGTHTVGLPAHGVLKLEGLLGIMGHPDAPRAIARVSSMTPGASFITTAVVNELRTLDSWEIVSFPVDAPPFADDFESSDTSRWSATIP